MQQRKNYRGWFSGNRTTQEMIDSHYQEPEDERDLESLWWTLKGEEEIINSKTGEVVGLKDGKLAIIAMDAAWLDIYNRYQKSQHYKEYTFTKVIERTAKGDAYSRMCFDFEWQFKRLDKDLAEVPVGNLDAENKVLKSCISSMRYMTELFRGKAQSHREFAAEFPVVYDYAIQNFTPRPPPPPPEKSEPVSERDVTSATQAAGQIDGR